MKYFQLLTFVILCFALPFSSCKNSEKENIRKEAKESLPTETPSTAPVTTTPGTDITTTSFTANSEPHYKCPNNCVGGFGSAAGNCPVCGTAMVHNQAFHNNQSNPTTPAGTPPVQATSPAQNAAGVYHYTCPEGHAGGSGTAGTCAVCGGALTHNQAYHN